MRRRILPFRLSTTTIAVLSCLGSSSATDATSVLSRIATVTLTSPESLSNVYAGFFSNFTDTAPPPGELVVVVAAGDGLCCSQAAAGDGSLLDATDSRPRVVLARRGLCTFVEKARIAQAAGASGVIVISDSELIWPMPGGNESEGEADVEIFALMIQNSTGELLTAWMRENPTSSLSLTLALYEVSKFYELLSFGIVICMATTLVVAGAFFSTADMRKGSPLAPRKGQHEEEVLEIDNTTAIGFCAMGSCMLVILFFLMKYLIYVIIFFFCVGGFNCLQQMGSMILSYNIESTKRRAFSLPLVGLISVAEAIATVPAAALICSWLVYRNDPIGWIPQDIIGAAFLCWMQRTLRLPNIQVATALLSVMFFFDIFWVFISPLIFHKSVMVEVAKGGGTGEKVPMLLRVPAIGDVLGGERMLGFGDIALPGLLISYLRRHDKLGLRNCCTGYFVPSVIGYFIGLCCTIVALAIMHLGQPALLYLVPGTLGTTYVLGFCRGEVGELWEGKPSIRNEEDDVYLSPCDDAADSDDV